MTTAFPGGGRPVNINLPFTLRDPSAGPAVPDKTVPLARLGVDSGGSLTERTNASDLALDLALRRAAGTYTLAFKDDGPKDGSRRRVEVYLRPLGLTAMSAASYAVRSDAMKRESLLQAAYVAPALFDTGAVRAALVPLRPGARGAWRSQLSLTFPVTAGATSKIEAAVSRGSNLIQELVRDVTLPASAFQGRGSVTATMIETIDLKPGKYRLAAVQSDAGASAPRATTVEIEVPEAPASGSPFIVGPFLGRRPEPSSVVSLESGNAFAPLPHTRVDPSLELAILTEACAPARKGTAASPDARRVLRTASGEVILEFRQAGDQDDRCTRHLDVVPAGTLAAGGDYVFEAGWSAGDGETKSLRFTTGKPQDVAASR